MGLFEDAVARIPGLVRAVFRGLAPHDREEIAQLVCVKMVEWHSVPSLWAVVKKAAIGKNPPTQPVPPSVTSSVPAFFEDAAARIPGLVRVILRNLDDGERQKIAQRVYGKLVEQLSVPYLRKVVRTTGIDYLTRNGREVALEDTDGDPVVQSPPPSNSSSTKLPPFAILKERLTLVYGNPKTEPYEALAFGYHTHLKYKPEEIALNLASLTIEDLAQALLRQCSVSAEIPAAQIVSCFSKVCGTPIGASKFGEYWTTEKTVAKWVKDVEEALELDSDYQRSRLCPDLSGAVPKPPNRRIAFSFGSNLGLDHRPEAIVMDLGKRTLEDLQTEFEVLYRPLQVITGKNQLEEWLPVIRMDGDSAERELLSYYTPSRTVGLWIEAVKRKLDSAELKQEKRGLKTMLDFRKYSAVESMAFLCTSSGFLGFPMSRLPRELAKNTVLELEQEIENSYASKWEFEKEAVARWFTPLREKLESAGVEGQPVGQHFPNDASVLAARQKVFAVVRPLFQGGAQLPLFAWRHGLL